MGAAHRGIAHDQYVTASSQPTAGTGEPAAQHRSELLRDSARRHRRRRLDQFVSVAGDTFRSHVTPTTFHALSQSLAPRMQRGCTPTHLGQLRQNGAQISLWSLAFADEGDDRLARMSMSQDRVGGFLITQAF
jgi:hypothetical protein